ncbi:hypothetical protein JB92DRAFT_2803234 [Gautieria morchelliformis]|nr:hypothetical protein JB92DRAFT_2803234 [Gautieria morchelliformis]
MDLPVIGGRCEAYGCGSFDFLPIRCNGCQKMFCSHHIILDSHACPSFDTNPKDDAPQHQNTSKKHDGQRCSLEGCQKPTLESVIVDTTHPEHRIVAVCSHCSGAFCASHRHSSDHACSSNPQASTASQKNSEARELLSKHFPTRLSSSTPRTLSAASKPPTDPKKIARLRAVELMKMRHHAIPVDPKDRTVLIPVTQRLHLKVVLNGSNPPTEKIVWLRKTVGTGRAVDLLATHFSIHISDTMAAYLDKLSTENGTPTRLRNDQPLSDKVEDGETLCLSTGPRA